MPLKSSGLPGSFATGSKKDPSFMSKGGFGTFAWPCRLDVGPLSCSSRPLKGLAFKGTCRQGVRHFSVRPGNLEEHLAPKEGHALDDAAARHLLSGKRARSRFFKLRSLCGPEHRLLRQHHPHSSKRQPLLPHLRFLPSPDLELAPRSETLLTTSCLLHRPGATPRHSTDRERDEGPIPASDMLSPLVPRRA